MAIGAAVAGLLIVVVALPGPLPASAPLRVRGPRAHRWAKRPGRELMFARKPPNLPLARPGGSTPGAVPPAPSVGENWRGQGISFSRRPLAEVELRGRLASMQRGVCGGGLPGRKSGPEPSVSSRLGKAPQGFARRAPGSTRSESSSTSSRPSPGRPGPTRAQARIQSYLARALPWGVGRVARGPFQPSRHGPALPAPHACRYCFFGS